MTSVGSKVFRDMDQAALDAAYDQSAYAPNRQQMLDRFHALSAAARDRLGQPERISYGDGRNEALDVYRVPLEGAPVAMFIHGGAWRSGSAAQYAFPAPLFNSAGVHYVVPDFDLVQDHAGDLRPMADQVQRAIAWVAGNAAHFGGDPARLHLFAHSSGAHLAAVALTSRMIAAAVPARSLRSALLVSGLYDLEPVRLSARSRYVAFTDDIVAALSPIRHVLSVSTPLTIAHASGDTPEFQRQSQDFAQILREHHHPAEELRGQGFNHFELLETLAHEGGVLGQAALRLLRTTP